MTSGSTPIGRTGHPVDIDHILPLVEKPTRYEPIERNIIRKEWTPGRVTFALAYPEVYEIGITHLGTRILYHIINRREDALAERAYCPWPDMEARMRADGIPMFSHESRMPLRSFDIVGFSLGYELTFTNALTMLDLAGIPFLSAQRDDDMPLVIAGGSSMANPEPVADVFDAFVVGDGEDVVGEVLDVVKATRGKPKADVLHALAGVEGVYVPSLYDVRRAGHGSFEISAHGDAPLPVRRRIVPVLRPEDFPERPLVAMTEATQDRLTVEVLRGCTQGCRFCQAGYYYRPVRERTPEDIIELSQKGVDSGGWDEIGLLSLSTADHSRIEELVTRLAHTFRGQGVTLSLPSLRADTFSVRLAESAGVLGKSGFTFAPETGTERLRKVINKNLTDDNLIEAVRAVHEKGVNTVKLYFMVGLPTETEEDLEGIVSLCNRVAAVGKRLKVNASIGCFVPKPFTPFQWVPFAGVEALHEKIGYLKRTLRNRSVDLRWQDPEVSWLEAVLSRGDRATGRAIIEAWQRGARFDGWGETFDPALWRASFEAVEVDANEALGKRPVEQTLPWDMLHMGVTRRYLEREYERSRRGETTPDCRTGGCNACGIPGAPDDLVLVKDVAPHQTEPEVSPPEPATRISQAEAGSMTSTGLFRVAYCVEGPFRFLGHGDMMRLIHRALQVADIPVAMSQGFRPRPKVSFGPPLPSGVTSDAEYMDIHLNADVDDLVDLINESLPEELRIVGVQRVEGKTESLSSLAHSAEYRMTIPHAVLAEEKLEAMLVDFGAKETFPVTRVQKGKERTVDLTKAMRGAATHSGDEATDLNAILKLSDEEGNTANPKLVLSELLGLSAEEAAYVKVRRVEFYTESMVPVSALFTTRTRSKGIHRKRFEFLRHMDV